VFILCVLVEYGSLFLSVLFIKISQFLLLMVYMDDKVECLPVKESGVKVQKIVQVMKANGSFFFFLAQQLLAGQGILIIETS
jgi:hypothetical protein